MARLPRLTVPGYPHHVIHRGNNRQAVCLDDQDFQTLLALIAECAKRHAVALHSYVLMNNHFHLLATPEGEGGLPAMMQGVGRRYAQYFNKRHQRTGTLWEGRYRATLVQAERYLLACMAYIDLNPVRAGLVVHPADYRWSSYKHYAGLGQDARVTSHLLYWQLGNTPFAREAAYVDWVRQGLTQNQQAVLTDSVLKAWALGDQAFIATLKQTTTRRLRPLSAGRPKRAASKPQRS